MFIDLETDRQTDRHQGKREMTVSLDLLIPSHNLSHILHFWLQTFYKLYFQSITFEVV